MKKLFAIALFAVLAASAFALDLSAGGGLTLGSFAQTTYYEPWGPFDSVETVMTTVPFGFSAYFDATYGVAAVGLRVNGNTHSVNTSVFGSTTLTTPSDDNNRSGFLSMSLLGKYPFKLGHGQPLPPARNRVRSEPVLEGRCRYGPEGIAHGR